VQRQLVLSVAQGYQNTATADIDNQVAESNETNNVTLDFYTVTQEPSAQDSDGDGLTDVQEIALGTNPNNPVCGNCSCEAGESPATCAGDCQASGPVCGNATCETGETSANCPGDCGGGGGGGLDCGDFAVLLACASCIDDPSTCSALGVDEAGCNACLMGPMP
jgi:hypothetical protein